MRKAFFKFNFLLITTALLLLLGRQDLLAQPTFKWANSITETSTGGPFFGVSSGAGVTRDNNNNVITTGFFFGRYDFDPGSGVFPLNTFVNGTNGAGNIYVQKLDGTLGGLLWARHFGNVLFSEGTSITVDNNNDIYITGQFSNTIVLGGGVPDIISNSGSPDIFVIKLDGNTGTVLWGRNFGLAGTDIGNSITFNQNTNEIIFTGSYTTTQLSSSSLDVFVYSVDPTTGTDNWVRTFGDERRDIANEVTTDALGNIYMTGEYADDFFERDITTGANLSNVLLNAPTNNRPNTFVLKLDNGGNFTWVQGFNKLSQSFGSVQGRSIAVDNAQNTYITGEFNGDIDFDPGTGNTNTTGDDAFIVSLDATGAFRWLEVLASNGNNNVGHTIAIDQQGEVIVGGELRYATNLTPGGLFISRHFASTGIQDWIHTGGDGIVYSLVTGQCDDIYATGQFTFIPIDLDPNPNETYSPTHLGQSSNAFTLSWGSNTTDITLNDDTICAGENPLLTVNTNGGQFNNFDWVIEDNSGTQTTYQTTQGNLVLSPLSSTNAPYSVLVEATDPNGCTVETTAQIFVNPNPIVTLTPSGTIACGSGNNNIVVDANISNSTTSPYTYNWAWSGNVFNQTSTSTSNTLNTTISNTTTFNLNVSDGNGCFTEASSRITVLQASPVTITGDLNVCQGESPTYTVTNIPGATYLWSNGATTPSTTINNIQADIVLSVVVTDPNGCTSTDQITIVVSSPIAIAIRPPNTACAGDNLNFGVLVFSNPNNLTYQWSNNNSTTPFATYSNVSTGPLTVSVIVTDVLTGCISTDQVVINVNDLPAVVLTSTVNGVCQNNAPQQISVIANPTGGLAPYTYAWATNGQANPNAASTLTDNLNMTTDYNVVVTDENGCAATDQLNIPLNPTPVVGITASTTLPVCVNDPLTLTASPQNLNIVWSIPGNNPLTVPTSQIGTTNYAVVVTDPVTGCSDEENIDVEVVECCFAKNNNDYLRLDPDNPDPRLANYGIIRTVNGPRNFRIINSNYNRLPEHIYLADEVTLFVKGVGGTLDVTNADVVFGRNSGIYIEAETELIANNTVFRPCDETQTWDGIVVSGNDATANFRECTFINPTFGVFYSSATLGAVSGSLFLNAQHGIIGVAGLAGSITNNVFRVDDNAINLTYSDPTTIGLSGLGNVLGGNANYDLITARYNIQHSGIFTMSPIVSSTNAIISQNEFVNAMGLGANNPTFNGVLITSTQGINVSNNSFTNNDISVLVQSSQDISVENNKMEVTRRSTSDASFYQIVTFGPNNSSGAIGSTAIIKGNTIVNSADVQDLTPNVSFVFAQNANGQNIVTLAGSGAIYNFGNTNGGHIRIEDNDISGFEIGIYTQGSYANNVQIVNNRIRSNLYGIYQGDRQSFIGCNEIEMDLDANVVTDAGVVGIRADIFGHGSVNSGVGGIFGNCIRNTDRAIFMESQVRQGMGWIHIHNNYLYNYTEAGLYSKNFFIAGVKSTIRRNAFISNQPNGDPNPIGGGLGTGAFDVVTDNLSGLAVSQAQRMFVLDGNYFGEKGMRNSLQLGTAPIVISTLAGAPELKPFTSCGNMDVTSDDIDDFDSVLEGDWMTRCDDEAYGNTTPIAQRTNTGTQLNASYQSVLTDLMQNDPSQVEGLLISHIQSLTDLVDVEALYLTAQQFSLSTKANNWIEYYYQERKGNHTSAQQVLNNMTTETILEAEEVTVKKAYLDMAVRNTTTLTDATLIAELKVIAAHSLGLYKHTAREILHNSTSESYTFQYNPVKLYMKSALTGTRPDVGNNTDIRIHPNPATDQITVNIISDKSVEWTTAELYDIHGRLLLSQSVQAYSMSFDLETLAQGVYMITLRGEDGYETTEKFVKQ